MIPTLDEAEALRRSLPAALAWADEVVVSDGGSGDGTPELARRLGAVVVEGSPGRGPQMNRGAALATSDVLLFLHADTRLPPEAAEEIRRAIVSGAAGGAFRVRFDSSRWAFRLGSWWVNQRSRWFSVPLGDQAQFATRDAFDALGGFEEWPILEDLDFARRLRRHGRMTLLAGPATTSIRRFESLGAARTITRNYLIWGLFLLGVSPHRLAWLYRRTH
ncbi:MAG: TIGR04283 family arsenosugar biosynthesis glycosyltransferase [Acidobacteria bacterium]|nr:TIGR04283 family arsenosugar biosynthesis glycosyltransferase [Acidobacteriota bacterium]